MNDLKVFIYYGIIGAQIIRIWTIFVDFFSDASPVGGRPCPWGPAFWCQSPVHAEACGTFDHCRRMGYTFDD